MQQIFWWLLLYHKRWYDIYKWWWIDTEAGKAIIKTKSEVEEIFKEITKEKGNLLLKDLFNAKKITAEEAIQYGIIDKITGR